VPTINSFLRFLHASPGTQAIDIYTDGNLVIKDLAYNETSEYLVVGPGNIHIKVLPAGENTTPLLDTELNIPPSEAITVPIIGTLPDISLLPILLSVAPRDNDDALFRFTNLSPTAPNTDLGIEGGATLFSNVGYTQVTEFEVIEPGSYMLQLRSSDGTVLASGTIKVKPRNAYTVYAIGLAEENPPLDIGFYTDQIPFFSQQAIPTTVFRKDNWSVSKVPRITLVYK
jgi:hypothetical protein